MQEDRRLDAGGEDVLWWKDERIIVATKLSCFVASALLLLLLLPVRSQAAAAAEAGARLQFPLPTLLPRTRESGLILAMTMEKGK